MKSILLTIVFSLLLVSSLVHAQEKEQTIEQKQPQKNSALKWDSATLSYQTLHLSGTGNRQNGLSIQGSKLLIPHLFIIGSYRWLKGNAELYSTEIDLDTTDLSLGIGATTPIFGNVDIFTIFSYEKTEVTLSSRGHSGSSYKDGEGLEVGLRSLLADKFELSGAVKYTKIVKSELATKLKGAYYFTDSIAAAIGYNATGEYNNLSLSIEWYY